MCMLLQLLRHTEAGVRLLLTALPIQLLATASSASHPAIWLFLFNGYTLSAVPFAVGTQQAWRWEPFSTSTTVWCELV